MTRHQPEPRYKSEPILLTILIALATGAVPAAAQPIEIAADALARLGIAVGRPTVVSDVAVATVPAEVVIPPAQQAAATAPVSGVVTRLFVATGEHVKAGQPLAELSSAEYMELERQYLDASAADGLAQTQLERDEGLLADGIIASRRMQETAAAAEAASLRREQTRRQLALAGLDNDAIARLAETRALSPTLVLRATFDAVVVEQYANVGEPVDALSPIVRLADLSRLWLEAHVPNELATRIRPGMRMTTADGGLAAGVTTVARVVEPVTQTVLVRGTFEAGTLALSVGQLLTVSITTATDAAYAVPGSAITRSGDRAEIFVRDSTGFRAVPVDLVAEVGQQAYVRGPIDASDSIAVDGISALKALSLGDAGPGD